MKAVIAGTAGLAVPLVLQGCDGDDDFTTTVCAGKDAETCIMNNSDGACHWNPATSPEECETVENFDDALFEATYSAEPADTLILFSDADESGEREEPAGCEDFDAVPAQRMYSKCQAFPDYSMESRSAAEEGAKNIRWDSMEQRSEFFSQKVTFLLPNITEGEVAEDFYKNLTYLEAWAALPDGADWTPFGAADIALGSDDRLECEGWLWDKSLVLEGSDPRYDESVAETEFYVKLFPAADNANNAGNSNQHKQFRCGPAGRKMTSYEWRLEADAEGMTPEAYWDSVFADKEAGFGAQAWRRFRALSYFAQEVGVAPQTVSITQQDLDANNFLFATAYEACQSDRNCGLDFATSECVLVADYCAQFDASSCPTMELHDMIPHFEDVDGIPSTTLNAPSGVSRELAFAGKAYFNLDGSDASFQDAEGNNITTKASKCFQAEEDAACEVHPEFISCETIGVPTQESSDENVAAKIFARPEIWDPEIYDAYDLTTFSMNYEIQDSEENPRGCVLPRDEDSNSYRNGVFGYPGPMCTHPLGWACSVLGVEPEPVEPAEETDDLAAAGEETEGDDEGDETKDEEVPFVSAEACNVGLDTICRYKPVQNGQCMLAGEYYDLLFGEAEVESFVLTFKEVEETEEDPDETEDQENPDETEDPDDGVQDESAFVQRIGA
jgi:hypothetical protein